MNYRHNLYLPTHKAQFPMMLIGVIGRRRGAKGVDKKQKVLLKFHYVILSHLHKSLLSIIMMLLWQSFVYINICMSLAIVSN